MGLYRKYRSYKKSWKFQNFILVPGVRKTDFNGFSENLYEKNPEYGNLERDDDSGNLEWDDGNLGSASEPSETIELSETRGPPIAHFQEHPDVAGSFQTQPGRSLVASSHSRQIPCCKIRLNQDSQVVSLSIFHIFLGKKSGKSRKSACCIWPAFPI